ncbi:hypothetical protein ACQ4PT_001405 [Festuca glaucescens]
MSSSKIIEISSIEMNKFRSALHASRQQNLNLARANSQITALKVLQHELACATIVHKLKGSGLERKSSTANNQLQKEVTSQENEMNKQAEQEVNVEEGIQEVDSKVAAVGDLEAHQIDDKAIDASPNHLPETQSSPQYDIKQPNPPQKRANRRVASKRKLESCEGQKDSNIEEDITAKLHSTSSEPLHHEETRNSKRRKSSRTDPVPLEVTEGTLETAQEDIVAPLPPSSSKLSIEQSETEKQNSRRSSTEPPEEQATGKSSVEVTGRRSSMRGAAKAVSYKEIPLNVKMRRP